MFSNRLDLQSDKLATASASYAPILIYEAEPKLSVSETCSEKGSCRFTCGILAHVHGPITTVVKAKTVRKIMLANTLLRLAIPYYAWPATTVYSDTVKDKRPVKIIINVQTGDIGTVSVSVKMRAVSKRDVTPVYRYAGKIYFTSRTKQYCGFVENLHFLVFLKNSVTLFSDLSAVPTRHTVKIAHLACRKFEDVSLV